MVKKIRRYLYSFSRISRTWWTDRRTPHHGIYRAYAYASCGKKLTKKYLAFIHAHSQATTYIGSERVDSYTLTATLLRISAVSGVDSYTLTARLLRISAASGWTHTRSQPGYYVYRQWAGGLIHAHIQATTYISSERVDSYMLTARLLRISAVSGVDSYTLTARLLRISAASGWTHTRSQPGYYVYQQWATSGPLTNKWVVVHEIVQRSRAKRKASDDLPRLYHFASICDDAKLDQVDDTVTEHLRVNAKIAVIC